MAVLEIYDRFLGDFLSVSWRYLIDVLGISIGVHEVCLRYILGVLEIFDRCPGYI